MLRIASMLKVNWLCFVLAGILLATPTAARCVESAPSPKKKDLDDEIGDGQVSDLVGLFVKRFVDVWSEVG
jgi:hypothetical protein